MGRSLGAGGCALVIGDSLIQPGVFAGYRIIATGPLRAEFELTYRPVKYGEVNIVQTMHIALDAGTNLNRIAVLFQTDGSPAPLPFAAGIVKRKGVVLHADTAHCAASLWGMTTENPEQGFLGTGIVMEKGAFSSIRETPVHLLVAGSASAGQPVTYYAGAGWTRSGDFASDEDWLRYVKQFALKLRSRLAITLSALK